MSKVVFRQIMTFDVLFDVVIFVVVINSFRRCDYLLFDVLIFSFFDVLIALIKLFDVVIVSNFFNVLFGFRRCEIRSSDLFPFYLTDNFLINNNIWKSWAFFLCTYGQVLVEVNIYLLP
jgi:hypothetical protein